MKSLKDVLYKLIARDFIKWVEKNDYMDNGLSPLNKQYADDALKSNTPDKESLKQAVIEGNPAYHKVSVTLEEKIIDSNKTISLTRSEEYRGNVIENIDYIDKDAFEQEIENHLYIGQGLDVADYSGIEEDLYESEDEYLLFPEDDYENLSEENKLLLDLHQQYYNVSAPVIDNNKEFIDIYRAMYEDNVVEYDIKYNPLGFGENGNYYFMYVNTGEDEYECFRKFGEVKKYMSEDSIQKFEAVSETIENIRLILNQLPIHFYSDKSLLKMMSNYFENEKSVTLSELYKQVNSYVLEVQKSAIVMDLKKTGYKAEEKLIHKIIEFNKITKNLNTIEDIKNNNFNLDSAGEKIIKDINKTLQHQAAQILELQM